MREREEEGQGERERERERERNGKRRGKCEGEGGRDGGRLMKKNRTRGKETERNESEINCVRKGERERERLRKE